MAFLGVSSIPVRFSPPQDKKCCYLTIAKFKDGQFLGDTVVTLSKGDEELASVSCGGPWVLFRLMPGAYSVTAETEGIKQTSKVTVREKGQARVVMSFPSLGGAIAPP